MESNYTALLCSSKVVGGTSKSYVKPAQATLNCAPKTLGHANYTSNQRSNSRSKAFIRFNPGSNPGAVMDMEPCYYCMIYAPSIPHIWLHQLGQPWLDLWSPAVAPLT
ncbi:unnamed protein product [Boreogadus saida]